MEAVETTPEAVQDTQPESVEENNTQPAEKSEGSVKSDSQKVTELLKKGEDDPNVKYSDEELDLLDKHYEGKIEENPVSEAKEEPEDEEVEKPKKEEKKEVDPELKEALDEVGAKDLKELPAKIKELRKALGGKDAQAVAKLNKEVESLKSLQQNEIRLWEDYKKGIPEAVNIMRQRGIEQSKPENVKPSENLLIDKDKFIDPESADLVNGVISGLKDQIDELKNQMSGVLSEKERYINENADREARNSVIDEMVRVSQKIPEFKDVPNIRELFNDYHQGKEANPKITEVFDELFDIANQSGTNIENAFLIKKGRDADQAILRAKQEGQKELYNQKPNPSLSDAQSGEDGSRNVVKPLTDEEINAMEDDFRLMPDKWFDKEGEPIKDRIPKKAWRLFGF